MQRKERTYIRSRTVQLCMTGMGVDKPRERQVGKCRGERSQTASVFSVQEEAEREGKVLETLGE